MIRDQIYIRKYKTETLKGIIDHSKEVLNKNRRLNSSLKANIETKLNICIDELKVRGEL